MVVSISRVLRFRTTGPALPLECGWEFQQKWITRPQAKVHALRLGCLCIPARPDPLGLARSHSKLLTLRPPAEGESTPMFPLL